ncbi:hypothetical protein [Pseudonocardia sp. ICBG1293]|uniref:hypothetical protein n=1 Tax=Pseudonocardia sp. ICBG1293 TaxID=2844382 RepID=UPI001CCC2916|nr:hypothetical protein [Pseudonocardia sp. ICBG1293]
MFPADVSPELLRTAWRTAARHHHPDRGGDPDRFIALSSAYELLTHTITALYDTAHDTTRPTRGAYRRHTVSHRAPEGP